MRSVLETVGDKIRQARGLLDSLTSYRAKRSPLSTDERSQFSSPSLSSLSLPKARKRGRPLVETGDMLAGRFCIGPLLGEGGMGTVYAAEDTLVGSMVAIKVIRPELVGDDDARRRLVKELRTARLVTHPNICRLYDVGECSATRTGDDNLLFLTMEMLHGETLAERLGRRPNLTEAEAKTIALQLCDALAALHKAGVVHRDFKPGNVMVTEKDGVLHAVVMDFGLSHGGDNVQETRSGSVGGTPAYMAPEQALGGTVSKASDIFPLGIVIAQMVTGLGVQATIDRDSGTPRLSVAAQAILRHVGLQWLKIVTRCLEVNPARRYGSIEQVQAALQAKPSGNPVQAKYVFAAALAVALVPASWVVWNYFRAGPGSVAVLPFVNATGDASLDYAAEGIAESLYRSLGRSPKLTVAAWSKSQTFKNPRPDLAAAGSSMHVDSIVTGKLRKDGRDLRLDVELREAATGNVLFFRSYQRPAGQLLALDQNLLTDLTPQFDRTVRAQLSAGTYKPNPQAYELCLRAYHEMRGRNTSDVLQNAVALFRQAIDLDPGYSLPHSGLADAYSRMINYSSQPPVVLVQQAKAEAQRAVELDQNSAEAQASYGNAVITSDFDWIAGEQAFRRAIALKPKIGYFHTWYAMQLLTPLKRYEEALIEINEAIRLDPEDTFNPVAKGTILFWCRRYEESLSVLRSASPKFPQDFVISMRANDLMMLGRTQDAVNLAADPKFQKPGSPYDRFFYYRLAILAEAMARQGRLDEAEAINKRLEAEALGTNINGCNLAAIQIALHHNSIALEKLRQCYESRDVNYRYIGVDSSYDELRSDAGFAALMQLAGLR